MYVIIGGSAAAIGCIEGIRSVDETTPITLITEEENFLYARPLISYLLCGKTARERLAYRSASFFEQNGVTVHAGVRAESLDAAAKTVALSSGETLPYDKLLLATGSSAFVPPVEGLANVEKAFCFLTLADADALAAALTPESRVLILGAGLTGVKCAEGILGRCKSVTIADLAPRVLPAVLDERAAAMVQKHMEQKGVQFYLGDSAVRFSAREAVLKSGATVPFDVLVTAVGVRPNVALAQQAGAQVNKGIVVDTHCRTTLPDVYAAGDCAEGWDAGEDTVRLLPLWSSAVLQGKTAGCNMAGGESTLTQDMAVNATGVCGLHFITAGSCEGESLVFEKEGSYKRLTTKNDALRGVIMVGDVARAGIYTNLIRTHQPLAELDFERICEAPQLMAFSRKERAQKLGGEV